MFKWKKLGKIFDPVMAVGSSWLAEYAQAPATLILADRVRVYFSGRPARDSNGQYVSYTGYLELDRNDLTKVLYVSDSPILPLGRTGDFDEFGIYPTSVIEVDSRVMAYYGGWTRCESVPYNVAIGIAVSTDGGKCFKRLGTGPVLAYSPDEPMTVSGPKIRKFGNKYFLFYVAGEKWEISNGRPESIFKIKMATSNDGVIWEKIGRDLIESLLEPDECQASPDVFWYQDRYHMMFSSKFGSDFRGTDRGYRIGYASSDDLYHWTREDSFAGISPSGACEWDGQSMAYPHVFELDGNLYMLYLGNEVGRHGFGLAVLESYS